jgi:hypothetical protein
MDSQVWLAEHTVVVISQGGIKSDLNSVDSPAAAAGELKPTGQDTDGVAGQATSGNL